LNVGVFEGAQGGGLSVVEPIYLESVLESDSSVTSPALSVETAASTSGLSSPGLKVRPCPSAREKGDSPASSPAPRRQSSCRPKLDYEAFSPLIDFVSRVTFERQEDLRDRHARPAS